jgi:transcriptional regulator with XRE-family HTH domain
LIVFHGKGFFMNFYQVIKEICRQEGINMRELGERTGIAHKTLLNYAGSKRTPSHKTLVRIASTKGLEKYRTALLGDSVAVSDEIQTLIQSLIEQGQEQQVLALLKEIRSESGHASESGEDDVPLL